MLRAILQHILMRAVAQVVLVLHADNLHNLARLFNLSNLDLAQPDMPDLALLLHRLHRTKRFLHRSLWVDPMQLPQVDPIRVQIPQAQFHLLNQILWPPHRSPPVRPLPRQSALRRNHQATRKRSKRLAYQLFAHSRTVRVCSVNEVDTQLHSPLQNAF